MKRIIKKIVSGILVSAIIMSSAVFATDALPIIEETPKTDIIIYSEIENIFSDNATIKGITATVVNEDIVSLPSLIDKLESRISVVEKPLVSLFSNTQDYITEDVFSLSTGYYLNSIISFNSMVACVNDLSINASSISASEGDFAVLYSQLGNINISASMMNFNGIIYAPNGNVTINAAKSEFNGVIVAKNVNINSSECILSYDNRAEEFIPKAVPVEDDCYSKPFSENDVIIDEKTGLLYVKNQIIITAQDNVTKEEIQSLAKSYNATIVGYLANARKYQLELTGDYTVEQLDEITAEIVNNSLVADSSTNTIIPMDLNSTPYTPNDPWEQGDNYWTESNPSGGNWGAEAINTRKAWEYKDKMQQVKV